MLQQAAFLLLPMCNYYTIGTREIGLEAEQILNPGNHSNQAIEKMIRQIMYGKTMKTTMKKMYR